MSGYWALMARYCCIMGVWLDGVDAFVIGRYSSLVDSNQGFIPSRSKTMLVFRGVAIAPKSRFAPQSWRLIIHVPADRVGRLAPDPYAVRETPAPVRADRARCLRSNELCDRADMQVGVSTPFRWER